MDLLIIMDSQGHLLQMVEALHSPRRLASDLNGWQQKRYQHTDNGNYYQ